MGRAKGLLATLSQAILDWLSQKYHLINDQLINTTQSMIRLRLSISESHCLSGSGNARATHSGVLFNMPNFHYQLFRIQIALPPALMKGYFGRVFIQARQLSLILNLIIISVLLFRYYLNCFVYVSFSKCTVIHI